MSDEQAGGEQAVDELSGRALDAAVAEEVMGLKSMPYSAVDDDFSDVWWAEAGDEQYGPDQETWIVPVNEDVIEVLPDPPPYSTSIEAAWEVAEQFDTYEVGRVYDTGNTFSDADGFHFRASLTRFSDEAWGRALAATAPLAICRAALKAVRQQGGPSD